ncbi:ankyrin repeat domain protein [Apiospora kogelbergensis]|uniref:ankyrin repeat domain protein n=1 Tax=Apiospora kogelbergensis TaxID=1337665 RepID=UPI0031313BB5
MSFDHRLALFEEFFGERAREDDVVTVSGICIAAITGVDSLRHYMGSIQRPTSKVRKMLLEIALSESTALGWHKVIEVLLEYGVNPNIPYLQKDFKFSRLFPDAQIHAIWDPATRAIWNHDERTLTMISDHGGSFSNDSILTAILEETKEDQDHSILTVELLKRFGFNPERFGDDKFVWKQFLEGACQKSLAKLFSLWKTYDIPFQKKFNGLDLLQLALEHHCEADIIQTLLDNGLEVHSIPYGPHGETMLHYALRSRAEGRQEIVALLLREGADPASGDPGLLLEAPLLQYSAGPRQQKDNLELYRLMLRNGASWPVNPDRCHTNLLTLLIENNAADQLIFEALDHGRCDLNLQGTRDNTTPLVACIQKNRTELAREFLRRGAKVDTRDSHWTALHAACSTGAPLAFIESLLDHGAQVDARWDPHSITPLHHAASSGFLNITSLLITRGAEINSSVIFDHTNEKGSNDLGYLNGSDVYIQGRRYTALDLAAGEGHFHVVQMLYDLGARSAYTRITSIDGAVQLARDMEHIGILKFFEDRLGSLDRTPDFHIESNVEGLDCEELF